MVKSYFRYQQERSIGIIASPNAGVLYDSTGEYFITPALEHVGLWSIRQSKMVHSLHYRSGQNAHRAFEEYDRASINVSSLARSHDGQRIGVGYQDGRVVVFKRNSNSQFTEWDLELNSVGHSTAVSCLCFSDDNSLLASGSDDTDIIVWDVVSSTGLYR